MNENQLLYTKRANLVIIIFSWAVLFLILAANMFTAGESSKDVYLVIGIASSLALTMTVAYVLKVSPNFNKWFAIISISLIGYYNLHAAQGHGTFRALFVFFESLALITLYLDKSAIKRYSIVCGSINLLLYLFARETFYHSIDLNSFIQFMVAFFGCTFLLYFITSWGEETLQKSEERWQFALEGNGDGVMDWSIRTKEVFFSPQWAKMIGYEEEEIKNDLNEWESRIHPDDHQAVMTAIEKHLNGETPFYSTEHRFRCKNGSYIWVLDRGKVMTRDRLGKPLRIICSHTDITQRKEAESQLEALQIQLIHKEKINSLAHLTAGVAHEINSPLGVIKSNLGLNSMLIEMFSSALEKPMDEEQICQVKSLVEKMKKSNRISTQAAERINGIIRTLERLSRLEDADWQIFDLNEGIESVLTPIVDEFKNVVHIHKHYGLVPKIPCIPSQINQVVHNLVVNRITAMEGKGDLYLNTMVNDGYVAITVRDTGKGISKDQQSRIFDPTLTSKGDVIGMELGLAIAYNIVQNHRGELLFHSQENTGSEFIVKLPV